MAVKIRLARHGAKKYPYYRVVVADARAPRDGRIICEVGRYNPNLDPNLITLDLEAIDEWIAKGAQPTDTVARLIKVAQADAAGEARSARGKKREQSKKAVAKAEEAAKAAEEAAAAAAEAAEDAAEVAEEAVEEAAE